MENYLIEAKNLCYKMGHKNLLYEINWTVQRNEHWIIFGLNGSGKTTLLSMISGYKIPTKGTLKIFGQQYSNENVLELRKQIGLVSSSFFDHYYNREPVLNIVLSGKLGTFGIDNTISNEDVRLAKKLLTELRLDDKLKSTFDQLSKGERQNVLLARALMNHPKILLLDEPENGLDIYARSHMQNTIDELAASGEVTLIYVTHYPDRIRKEFTKCLLLRHGCVFAKGNSDDMFTSQQMSLLFNKTANVKKNNNFGYDVAIDAPSFLSEICYQKKEGIIDGNAKKS